VGDIVKLENVGKVFRGTTIFKDFSLTVAEEEMVAIVGKSGAGKTTLLNIIGGLVRADAGEVFVNNVRLNKLKGRKILILYRYFFGYIFQNFALIDNESVDRNLDIALEYVKAGKKEKKKMKESVIARVGLRGKLESPVFELSGGEQQRVALARLMLKPCKLILADEPTGSLDEQNAKYIMDELVRLKNEGKAVLIVTHNNAVADSCDKKIEIGT
jgi:putative ABC transport system ATP-binding protein